eukprot:COSAG05_NODE_238_length_13155_cov_489.969899_4_plen_118_part_00
MSLQERSAQVQLREAELGERGHALLAKEQATHALAEQTEAQQAAFISRQVAVDRSLAELQQQLADGVETQVNKITITSISLPLRAFMTLHMGAPACIIDSRSGNTGAAGGKAGGSEG